MKGLGKIVISVGILSVLFILYVQGQTALFRVSYSLDQKSKVLAHKTEEYRFLRFEVDQLRAPRRLEEKMKELKLDLALPQEIRVVRVPASPAVVMPKVEEAELQPLSRGLLDILGRWVKVAQAKTES